MPTTFTQQLPLIRKKTLLNKGPLSISKIQSERSKTKPHSQNGELPIRKLSLNSRNSHIFEKRSLSNKRFSLKSIKTDQSLKNLKFCELNTDDNSETQKIFETFQECAKNPLKPQSITQKAVDLLKNMRQVDKIAKLYKRDRTKSKYSDQTEQNKNILKSKYKCLINVNVFGRKSKHNNSEETKPKRKPQKSRLMNDEFWQNINQSMILQSCLHEEPSKELFELVENIKTEA